MQNQISLGSFISQEKQHVILKLGIRVGDRLIGLRKMQQLYEQNSMQGLNKEDFADRFMQVLGINVVDEEKILSAIPRSGPLLIASNHPFGGVEGVIWARIIGKVRPDLKVLANSALKLFSELSDYFIFTNPLSQNDPKNGPSLRASLRHVNQGGALLIFPAGKVSFYQKHSGRIVEHQWNRIVGRLLQQPDIQYLPVFVHGSNSDWFYRVEKVYFKLRMLLLGRELLNKQGKSIRINVGNKVTSNRIDRNTDANELAALARAQYCHHPVCPGKEYRACFSQKRI